MTVQRKTVIEAEPTIFTKLFHRGCFVVPWHQRYYDWTLSEVQMLLDDVEEALQENRRCYFLGTILLVDTNTGEWEINDGQQRMVTISLICAAFCRRFSQEVFDSKDSQRGAQALRVLFDLDDTGTWELSDAENYGPRIVPPADDKMVYEKIIRGHSIGTNSKLTVAWDTIDKFLGSSNEEKKWEKYFDFVREKIEVAYLTVPPDIDPNAVYETINCRGKELDDVDRIRNDIYSYFNASDEEQRKNSVHCALEKLRVMFPSSHRVKASSYMRCALQCRFGYLRKDHFYRDTRKVIREQCDASQNTKEDYVYNLVQEITREADMELFNMITGTSPDPDIVGKFEAASKTTKSPRNLTVFLRELHGYKVTLPIVFVLLMKFSHASGSRRRRKIAKDVNRSLSQLSSFILRTAFVAPKFEPSHFEDKFANFAMELAKTSGVPDEKFKQFLYECDRTEYGVLDDNKFRNSMRENRLTGSGRIRQFLLGINRNGRPDATVLNAEKCTVEHILPQSAEHWENWEEFRDVDPKDWIHRVGNLTLLSEADNKPGEKYNSNFSNKRKLYLQSSFALTRELGKHHRKWTPEKIRKRQEDFAEIAVSTWKFE